MRSRRRGQVTLEDCTNSLSTATHMDELITWHANPLFSLDSARCDDLCHSNLHGNRRSGSGPPPVMMLVSEIFDIFLLNDNFLIPFEYIKKIGNAAHMCQLLLKSRPNPPTSKRFSARRPAECGSKQLDHLLPGHVGLCSSSHTVDPPWLRPPHE